MTGLDLAKDHLIEIAVLITNGNLDIVAKVSYCAIASTDGNMAWLIKWIDHGLYYYYRAQSW
jgi:oligoribonuclease (3'-5' exoribonuclease)